MEVIFLFQHQLKSIQYCLEEITVSALLEPQSWLQPHPLRNHAKTNFYEFFMLKSGVKNLFWKIEPPGSKRADTLSYLNHSLCYAWIILSTNYKDLERQGVVDLHVDNIHSEQFYPPNICNNKSTFLWKIACKV